jgi:signal transduction histidine kinase
VRELRELIERDLSIVILEARNAQRSMRDDPRATERSLNDIEAAGSEALEEAQRLTSLLLSPDGGQADPLGPGLVDLEYLAEEVTKAGLPVDTIITGRPLPLTADLDAVAYRVVHESLMAALTGTRNATADVYVRYEPDLLEIEVVDDGEAVGKGSQDTAELEAVRKEVASLGGTLDAGPRDGRGYRVTAQLPYEPDWG